VTPTPESSTTDALFADPSSVLGRPVDLSTFYAAIHSIHGTTTTTSTTSTTRMSSQNPNPDPSSSKGKGKGGKGKKGTGQPSIKEVLNSLEHKKKMAAVFARKAEEFQRMVQEEEEKRLNSAFKDLKGPSGGGDEEREKEDWEKEAELILAGPSGASASASADADADNDTGTGDTGDDDDSSFTKIGTTMKS